MTAVDLVIVKPGSQKKIYSSVNPSLPAIEPPLIGGLLAGFVRDKGYSVRIIDVEAQNLSPQQAADKINEYNPLLVNIVIAGANPSVSSTPLMVPTGEIIGILKKKFPYIKIILSGIHPSALPEKTLNEEEADFVCRGESFYTILKLLEVLKSAREIKDLRINGLWYKENGRVVAGGWGNLVEDIDGLPFAAWDLLPMEKYRAHNWHCFGNLGSRQPYAVTYMSLGCPFDCGYCNIHALYNGKPRIRFRSPKRVFEEIKFLVKKYNVKNIKIMDELFVLEERRVLELCRLLISSRYDLNIWAYSRVDTINERLLKMMKQAGINWLAYGIESAGKNIRGNMSKGKFDNKEIKRAIDMTHKTGIHVVANFIFGFPDEDLKTMQETLRLAAELNCEYTNFYVAMAYPGSGLYEDALKRGARLPRTWLGYAQFSEEALPLANKYLSAQEVLRFRDKAFKEFHGSPAYLKMIERKFGPETVEHIKEMLKYKIRRGSVQQ